MKNTSKEIKGLRIEKHALGGYGLGFEDGLAIFVPYAHPGDVVDVSITKSRKDHAFAEVQNYVSRGEPVPEELCPSFGAEKACGGCDWQDLSYASQLKYKLELLQELFRGKGMQVIPEEIKPSPLEFHYRNKVFMPITQTDAGLSFGIFKPGTHQVVTHEHCRIHAPVFDRLAMRVVELCEKAKVTAYDEASHTGHLRHIGIRISKDESQLLLILVTRIAKLPFSGLLVKKLTAEFPNLVGIVQNINREVTNVILGEEERLLYGQPYLVDELLDKQFRVHYQSFWQANSRVAELLLARIKSEVDEGCTLVDAYSGSGSIGIVCAEKTHQTICIESNFAATEDAEYNAQLNGVDNISFINADCADALPILVEETLSESSRLNVVLDPPRTGAQREVLDAIIASPAKKVIYMSCYPITLVRDLQVLIGEGGFQLKHVSAFDMFPQTWHIESLAILERR